MDTDLFSCLWKLQIPSKVLVFAWRARHNRIETLDNLRKRKIVVPNSDYTCVFCHLCEENTVHLVSHVTSLIKSG